MNIAETTKNKKGTPTPSKDANYHAGKKVTLSTPDVKENNIYKSNLFAKTANVVPYHKEFRAIAGSVTATILFQQLEYWFYKQAGKPFYKFLSPLDEEKYGYKVGDSWAEELGLSPDEFRTAFRKIGTQHKSKRAFDTTTDMFKEKMYCSYIDKMFLRSFSLPATSRMLEALDRIPRSPSTVRFT